MRAHDSDSGFDLACKEDQMLEANKACLKKNKSKQHSSV